MAGSMKKNHDGSTVRHQARRRGYDPELLCERCGAAFGRQVRAVSNPPLFLDQIPEIFDLTLERPFAFRLSSGSSDLRFG